MSLLEQTLAAEQQQTQQLSQYQLQGLNLLQMSAQELESCLNELTLENPVIEIQEKTPPEEQKTPGLDQYYSRLKWLEENDRQNRELLLDNPAEGEENPINRIGMPERPEENLEQLVRFQLARRRVSAEQGEIVIRLVELLDHSGYLTESDEELGEILKVPPERLYPALELLRSLNPAGIGARSLSDCLLLQLERLAEQGPAIAIARDYLPALAQRNYRKIAKELKLSGEDMLAAKERILQLNPRPCMEYRSGEPTQYIYPDIIIEENGEHITARLLSTDSGRISFNRYYLQLMEQTTDPELSTYLNEKLREAKRLQTSLQQRESTVLRCACYLAEHQRNFFQKGEAFRKPLKMTDLAAELGVAVSTVSRAVRLKYMQCRFGIFPMSYFFSNEISGETAAGTMTAANALRKIIEKEDPHSPLSDQQLAELLCKDGFEISRRTVAKYRERLRILPRFGRKQAATVKKPEMEAE